MGGKKTIEDMVDDLREAAAHEGTELGEMWNGLADAYDSALYRYGPESIQDAIRECIIENHDLLMTEFEKTTREVTTTRTVTKWSMKGEC